MLFFYLISKVLYNLIPSHLFWFKFAQILLYLILIFIHLFILVCHSSPVCNVVSFHLWYGYFQLTLRLI